MATEHIREKINVLRSLIANEDINKMQHELVIEDAKASLGDKQLDEQMKSAAQNAAGSVKACDRRMEVRRALLEKLTAELAASEKQAK